MYDNDKLLKDFGQIFRKSTIIDGLGHYDIKHAIPFGKRNVRFINIRETYDPNSFESYQRAKHMAEINYQKLRYG